VCEREIECVCVCVCVCYLCGDRATPSSVPSRETSRESVQCVAETCRERACVVRRRAESARCGAETCRKRAVWCGDVYTQANLCPEIVQPPMESSTVSQAKSVTTSCVDYVLITCGLRVDYVWITCGLRVDYLWMVRPWVNAFTGAMVCVSALVGIGCVLACVNVNYSGVCMACG
jgi:hypothetical protein